MSILLEALKKSEQQRQLGDTPTISTPVETFTGDRDDLQHWIPLSLMALSVIILAWFGWQQYQGPRGTAAAPEPARQIAGVPAGERAPSGESAAVTDRGTPSLDDGSKAAPATSGEKERTPVEAFQAPQQEQQIAADPVPQEAPPGGSESTQEAPPPDAGSGQFAEEAVSESAAPPEPRSRVQPHESEPISYWELPQGVRDDLPEIRITVLVYAEKPEDRFLLMSGKRLLENEEVEGGLVLQEIRREGAVFKYRKYRFLVKG
jgi:general secretion pathway protein B